MNRQERLIELSIDFTLHIVDYYRWLTFDQKEYIISQQLIRCVTYAGATIHETFFEYDHKNFSTNIEKALQHIIEADCCLALLERTGYIHSQFVHTRKQCETLRKMLTSFLSLANSSYQSPEIIGVAR